MKRALVLAVFASSNGFASETMFSEYTGREFDGQWQWSGLPIRGSCAFAKTELKIHGSEITGKMTWFPKQGSIQSNIVGVIHEDMTVDIKIKSSMGEGKTSIGKGRVDFDEMFISERAGRCNYDFRLIKAK